MGAIETSRAGAVLVVTFDLPNEPVNKITREVRGELEAVFEELDSDSELKSAILISGKPENFIAGADIEEFVALEDSEEAFELVSTGQELVNRFTNPGKPFVAAINGTCLGGGLEAALACSYRIATTHAKTQLGLPEVQIGILPAAGGCQRLPRLIGLAASLDMILTGKNVDGKKAHRLGLVDELVHPAMLYDVALTAARRLAAGWRPTRRIGWQRWLMDRTSVGRSMVMSAARKRVLKTTRGNYPAPLRAIETIATGLSKGMARGLSAEASHFAELAVGDVSRNLVGIFFATTALKKDLGVDSNVTPRTVANLGIVGAGFMGAAIGAVAAMRAGSDVRLQESDWERLSGGLGRVRKTFDDRRRRRRITKFEHRDLAARVTGSVDWQGFARADLVIEAVFEDLEVKRSVFAHLAQVTGSECVLASNTSTIPIEQIAQAVETPGRVIGMHFFSPVEKMPLLEVIAARDTRDWAVATAVAYGRQMGKTVIVVRDRPGFWVNRILTPYLNEAGRLLQEGAGIEKLDALMRRFGFPVGPATLLDEVGLDVAVKAAAIMKGAFGARLDTMPGLARLVEAGRLGRKSGAGLYRYDKGQRRGVDNTVYELIGGKAAAELPPNARARLVYAMLNEAALAIDEGVVRSARDGDVGAIFGIGYPPFLGGPFRYIDSLGAAAVADELGELAAEYGERFEPAPLLIRMAERGERFYQDRRTPVPNVA